MASNRDPYRPTLSVLDVLEINNDSDSGKEDLSEGNESVDESGGDIFNTNERSV